MEENNKYPDLTQADEKTVAEAAVRFLYQKKARNLKMIYVADKTVLTDYYVIGYGRSSAHLKALAAHIDDEMGKCGKPAHHLEGKEGGEWILADFGTVIVHLFSKEAGEFYRLERLFPEESFMDISPILDEIDATAEEND